MPAGKSPITRPQTDMHPPRGAHLFEQAEKAKEGNCSADMKDKEGKCSAEMKAKAEAKVKEGK